jgi:exonuclease III
MNANTISYSVVSWNVRGLGDADKCKTVRDVLASARLDVACIQETKLGFSDSVKTHTPSSLLPSWISLVSMQTGSVVAFSLLGTLELSP